MQKALRLMNFLLDIAISDIVGVSGVQIIKAILEGETSAEKLAQYCDNRVNKARRKLLMPCK